MTIESSVTFLDDLNVNLPFDTDPVSEGATHLRNIKTSLKETFPNLTEAVTLTAAQINALGWAATVETTIALASPTITITTRNADLGTVGGLEYVEIDSELYIYGVLDLGEDLLVRGNAVFQSNLTVWGDLEVQGEQTLSGSLDITGDLAVDGSVKMQPQADTNYPAAPGEGQLVVHPTTTELIYIDGTGVEYPISAGGGGGITEVLGSYTVDLTASVSLGAQQVFTLSAGDTDLQYVKTGSLVHVTGRLRVGSVTGDNSALLQITLPYPAKAGLTQHDTCTFSTPFDGTQPGYLSLTGGQSVATIAQAVKAAAAPEHWTDIFTVGSFFYFGFSYLTDS